MANILITGGTGFVGTALVDLLCRSGHNITILTRPGKKDGISKQNVAYAHWDISKQVIDETAIKSADHIIHLAGAGVADKRWTQRYKKEIVESRTRSSDLLVNSLRSLDHNVRSIISASAIGWYGEDKVPPLPFVETMPADEGFLGQTCLAWENSIKRAEELGIRVVCLRTGIVFDKEGGALREFIKPIKFGVVTILGSGKQVISWIHRQDLVRAYQYAMENEGMSGSYNATSNVPVTNKELVIELAQRIRGGFSIPVHVPAFVLKIMMGESSIEVLKSTTCSNEKIHSAGFKFLYPTLNAAMDEMFQAKDQP